MNVTYSALPAAVTCDCCGAMSWRAAFSEGGFTLGRCISCGLYYVSPMPSREVRTAEVAVGLFANDRVAEAAVHGHAENERSDEFKRYVELTRSLAPPGPWLDIGCGTGTLIRVAQLEGIPAEGIELSNDRREVARTLTGAQIYGEPLEDLGLPSASYAAITMVHVFSHLTSPTQTLEEIHRVLKPGGILMLQTGELGPGAERHHAYSWALGDHLYWLGLDTIDRYAKKCGFVLEHRNRVWLPTVVYSKENFLLQGRSPRRNKVKWIIARTPGVLPALRMIMLKLRQADSPLYQSTLVLRRDD